MPIIAKFLPFFILHLTTQSPHTSSPYFIFSMEIVIIDTRFTDTRVIKTISFVEIACIKTNKEAIVHKRKVVLLTPIAHFLFIYHFFIFLLKFLSDFIWILFRCIEGLLFLIISNASLTDFSLSIKNAATSVGALP